MFEFIRAGDADTDRVAAFADRIFRVTFSPFHDVTDIDAYCLSAFGGGQQRLELQDRKRQTWLAVTDGAIAGYYQLISGKLDPSVDDTNPACLNRLYVDPLFHGQRLAHALMEHVLEQARAGGHATLWLGVWSKNDRALAFYRKWNFVEVGAVTFVMGKDHERDLVLSRLV